MDEQLAQKEAQTQEDKSTIADLENEAAILEQDNSAKVKHTQFLFKELKKNKSKVRKQEREIQ
jgi:hypothetical protein